jgi:hypothetical protein
MTRKIIYNTSDHKLLISTDDEYPTDVMIKLHDPGLLVISRSELEAMGHAICRVTDRYSQKTRDLRAELGCYVRLAAENPDLLDLDEARMDPFDGIDDYTDNDLAEQVIRIKKQIVLFNRMIRLATNDADCYLSHLEKHFVEARAAMEKVSKS